MKNTNKIILGLVIAGMLSSCGQVKEMAWRMKNLRNDKGVSVAKANNLKDKKAAEKTVIAAQSETLTAEIANYTTDVEMVTASTETSPVIINNSKVENTYESVSTNEVKNLNKAEAKAVNKLNKTKEATTKSKKAADNKQVIAIVLCFFLGLFGIHRFYYGYIGIGIFQLLTLGGFGIWTFIDLIRLILNDLQPKYDNNKPEPRKKSFE